MNTPVPSVFTRRRQLSLSANATAELGGLMPPHVSIRGNRFALVDAAGTRFPLQTMHLDCVIVDINEHKSKTYWGEEKFDPNAVEFTPPVCYSDNGVGPSANAQEPQARTCVECPHNRWSKINEVTGNKNKPCSDRKKLAILPMSDNSGLVYQLQVPPASLTPLRVYSNLVSTWQVPGVGRQADLNDVVTRVTFIDSKNGELEFQPVCWISSLQRVEGRGWLISQNQAGQVIGAPDGGLAFGDALDTLMDAGVTDDVVGRKDTAWTGVALPAPAPVQQIAAPAPTTPAPQLQAPAQAAPPASPTAHPAAAGAPKHGGSRPGSGRKPRPAAPPAAPAPAAEQPMDIYPPGAAIPAQEIPAAAPAPTQQRVAAPQMLAPADITSPQPAVPTNPAFAQPQQASSAIDEALSFAMSLKT